MNNEEALAVLEAKRAAVNAAIDGVIRYAEEVGERNYSATVKSRRMAAVKESASDAGSDITAWDGTPAPEVP